MDNQIKGIGCHHNHHNQRILIVSFSTMLKVTTPAITIDNIIMPSPQLLMVGRILFLSALMMDARMSDKAR
jgi:hypothetical protein